MKNLCGLTLLRTCNELSCPGVLSWSGYLHTLQLLCLLSISPAEFLPPDLEAPAQSRKESQIGIGCGNRIIIWYPWLSGTWDFPAESLTVLTCTEPGADGEGKLICQLLSRPAWAEEFAVVALDVWSARELCFLDIWRKFPCIWAVFMIGLGRVSGEEQSESY